MPAIVGTVVNPTNLALNIGANINFVTATNAGTLVTDTQTFEVNLTKPEPFCAIIIQNFGATVNFWYQVMVGTPGNTYWASGVDEKVISILAGQTHAINIEGAKFTKQNSTISIKLFPITGNALKDSARIGVIQLPY
jgi:hypothetical protein